MLNDAATGQFKKIYLAPGYCDMRRGIDGLANIVRFQYHLDPYDRGTLFLFCGKRSTKLKALLWEGDGFLLMMKRLDYGAFHWPRTPGEAMELTKEQYQLLMQGFEIVPRNPITQTDAPPNRF